MGANDGTECIPRTLKRPEPSSMLLDLKVGRSNGHSGYRYLSSCLLPDEPLNLIICALLSKNDALQGSGIECIEPLALQRPWLSIYSMTIRQSTTHPQYGINLHNTPVLAGDLVVESPSFRVEKLAKITYRILVRSPMRSISRLRTYVPATIDVDGGPATMSNGDFTKSGRSSVHRPQATPPAMTRYRSMSYLEQRRATELV